MNADIGLNTDKGLNTLGVAFALLVLLSSCAYMTGPKPAIPTQIVAAVSPGNLQRLVIVLPGIGDSLSVMRRSGIVEAVQHNMPDADVILVELTLPYYIKTPAVHRLHQEIVMVARKRGYREIYLAGASMGGMGVLMYEHEFPKETQGLILMAPFMGNASMVAEISAAGGLDKWNPGPVPDEINGNTAPRENWRLIKSWSEDPTRARSVWLICGESDRFHSAAKIIATRLPQKNFISRPGGHSWKTWSEGATQVFAALQEANKPDLAKH